MRQPTKHKLKEIIADLRNDLSDAILSLEKGRVDSKIKIKNE